MGCDIIVMSHLLKNFTNVDHQASSERIHGDPFSRLGFNFKSSTVILQKQCQKPGIFMRSNPETMVLSQRIADQFDVGFLITTKMVLNDGLRQTEGFGH